MTTAELHVSDGGIEMRARTWTDAPPGSYWYRDDRHTLSLAVRAPVGCRLDGVRTNWHLCADTDERCPFGAFALRALAAHAGTDADADSSTIVADLTRLCEIGATRAVAGCDRSARHLALGFAADARLFVYAALLEDWWRRVEQALGACPGAFVVGSAFPSLSDYLIDSIQRGDKLTRVLARYVDIARATNQHAATLIRRAPRELAPEDLLALMREPAIDVNDMPTSERELAAWYRWGATVARGARPLAPFVSKHALELEWLALRRGLDARWQLEEIRDWLVATNASLPSRRSAPAPLLARIDDWHRHLHVGLDVATPLPPGPAASACIDGIVARPLTTVGALADEGRRMHHCVGWRAEVALTKRHAFYHASVHGEPITIEVARASHGWYLVEASGLANRRPSHPEVIGLWVRGLVDSPGETSGTAEL